MFLNKNENKNNNKFCNLPVACMLFRLALTENGDINSLSKDKDLAINAIAFAVICNLTGSRSPSH